MFCVCVCLEAVGGFVGEEQECVLSSQRRVRLVFRGFVSLLLKNIKSRSQRLENTVKSSCQGLNVNFFTFVSSLIFIFAPYASAKTTDRFKFGGFITRELGGGQHL